MLPGLGEYAGAPTRLFHGCYPGCGPKSAGVATGGENSRKKTGHETIK
jgi:hypothetical protein